MHRSRRQFLRSTAGAFLSTALGSQFAPSALARSISAAQDASASAVTDDFDIDQAFAAFMQDLGRSADDAGGTVTFTGRDPILRSHFRIGTCMALPAMAAAVGAAAIWKARTGESQDLKVDLRESVYNINPIIGMVMQQRQKMGALPADDVIANSITFVPSVNGKLYQAPLGLDNPMSFIPFETKDGRYMNITGIYPHLYHRALNVLNAPPDRASIIQAVKQWDAEALDQALADAGAVAGIHRTAEEWLATPEGKYLANKPLIEIVKVADSDPVPFTEDPEQPLSGIRCLSLTHVIAGTTAARTLAEQGAEVLQIARDQSFEHEALVTDVNVGMRSAWLDLRTPKDKQTLMALLPKADVFIEGFRGRSIKNLGFAIETVAKKRPGIVYLSLRGYSWDGPWKDRAAFDMEAVTVTGYTMAEGDGKRPQFPPTLVLNDYIAGYLGAAGITEALRRRAESGGSYHVRISLARAAMWYKSLGMFPSKEFDAKSPEHRMQPPEILTADSPYGEVRRLAPQVKYSKTPGRWREPLVSVRGSDLPRWET
ncbi:CoA transferase [Microbulbifer elongatus]|uniref:CoA transferase n=1 Tax=Microbulbifer elongatus TaxID=86173 RepID=UPI001CFD5F31|nr:CoA transferase [Microbulbifer elongatus]